MPRDALVLLEDILEACEKIARYTAELSIDAFRQDAKTLDAVARNLEIIGEAAKKLPADVRNEMSGIEWNRIAGLRDVLIHNYFGIDADIIWDVVQTKIPALRTQVAARLQK